MIAAAFRIAVQRSRFGDWGREFNSLRADFPDKINLKPKRYAVMLAARLQCVCRLCSVKVSLARRCGHERRTTRAARWRSVPHEARMVEGDSRRRLATSRSGGVPWFLWIFLLSRKPNTWSCVPHSRTIRRHGGHLQGERL